MHFLKVILNPLNTGQFYIGDLISEKPKWEGISGLCAHRARQKQDLATIHTRQQLTTTWLVSGSLPAPADVIFIHIVASCGEQRPGAG